MSWPETLARLTKWSDDELHFTQSVRSHEPIYKNPAELRRDVRELLAEHEKVCEMFDNVMGTLHVDYEDMFPEEEDDG